LDDVFEALAELAEGSGELKATSVRQPAALRRAAEAASELGMDESYTAATNRALEDRVRAFARQQALTAHFERFPADRPRLADVALRRVQGTEHPAAGHPEMVETVAEWLESHEPDWMMAAADETVGAVLHHVWMLAEGVGVSSPRVAR
jgi:hypothetical protein